MLVADSIRERSIIVTDKDGREKRERDRQTDTTVVLKYLLKLLQ